MRFYLLCTASMVLSSLAFATSGDLDIEQYDAYLSGSGVLNQPYGRTDEGPEDWRFGLGLIYSDRPLDLIRINSNDSRSSGTVIPGLMRYEFLARRQWGSIFDFQMAAPVVQGLGHSDWPIGGRTAHQISSTTLGDFRFSAGVDLWRWWQAGDFSRKSNFGLALRTTVWVPTGDVDSFHGEGHTRFEPRLVFDYKEDRWHVGASLGYLIRPRSQIFHIVNDDAYRWGLFARGPLYKELDWTMTVWGSLQTARQIDPSDATKTVRSDGYDPREYLMGAIIPTKNYELTAAAGSGLNSAVGAPAFRAVLQVAFNWEKPSKKTSVSEQPLLADQQIQSSTPSLAEKKLCSSGPFCDDSLLLNMKISFRHNRAQIPKDQLEKLKQVATFLAARPDIEVVEVKGFASPSGSQEYNDWISKLRAENVATALIQNGVPQEKLKISFFGKSQPLFTDGQPEHQKQNRRVEFSILTQDLK